MGEKMKNILLFLAVAWVVVHGGRVVAAEKGTDDFDYCEYKPPTTAYASVVCQTPKGPKSISLITPKIDEQGHVRLGPSEFDAQTLAKARSGDGKSSYLVGQIYIQILDTPAAQYWFHRGADAGDVQSMISIGNYNDGGLVIENGVTTVHRDMQEAVKWYRMAAEKGDALAMLKLGLLYTRGRGIAADPAEGVRWFKQAVDAGNLPSMRELAACYAQGNGVKKDMAEAIRLYRLPAEKNDPIAAFSLAEIYEVGSGAAKDEAEAARLYRIAAGWGDKKAMLKLSEMYHDGRGVPKDESAAQAWRQKSEAKFTMTVQSRTQH